MKKTIFDIYNFILFIFTFSFLLFLPFSIIMDYFEITLILGTDFIFMLLVIIASTLIPTFVFFFLDNNQQRKHTYVQYNFYFTISTLLIVGLVMLLSDLMPLDDEYAVFGYIFIGVALVLFGGFITYLVAITRYNFKKIEMLQSTYLEENDLYSKFGIKSAIITFLLAVILMLTFLYSSLYNDIEPSYFGYVSFLAILATTIMMFFIYRKVKTVNSLILLIMAIIQTFYYLYISIIFEPFSQVYLNETLFNWLMGSLYLIHLGIGWLAVFKYFESEKTRINWYFLISTLFFVTNFFSIRFKMRNGMIRIKYFFEDAGLFYLVLISWVFMVTVMNLVKVLKPELEE